MACQQSLQCLCQVCKYLQHTWAVLTSRSRSHRAVGEPHLTLTTRPSGRKVSGKFALNMTFTVPDVSKRIRKTSTLPVARGGFYEVYRGRHQIHGDVALRLPLLTYTDEIVEKVRMSLFSANMLRLSLTVMVGSRSSSGRKLEFGLSYDTRTFYPCSGLSTTISAFTPSLLGLIEVISGIA